MAAMRLRRILGTLTITLLFLCLPALVAPYIAKDPVAWAYRAYHPFMYRFPATFGAHTSLELQSKTGVDQSLYLMRLMIRHW